MQTYVMLTTLTDEGRKTIRNNPERILEVNQEMEGLGVKLLHQFVSLGAYDFVNIVEAPSTEDVMKIAVELGARGTLETHTMPVITVEKFIQILKQEKVKI